MGVWLDIVDFIGPGLFSFPHSHLIRRSQAFCDFRNKAIIGPLFSGKCISIFPSRVTTDRLHRVYGDFFGGHSTIKIIGRWNKRERMVYAL